MTKPNNSSLSFSTRRYDITGDRNDWEIINLSGLYLYTYIYLKLRKHCNFWTKNSRRAWHVIGAQCFQGSVAPSASVIHDKSNSSERRAERSNVSHVSFYISLWTCEPSFFFFFLTKARLCFSVIAPAWFTCRNFE